MFFKSIIEDYRFRFIADLAVIFSVISSVFIFIKALKDVPQIYSFIDNWWKSLGLVVVAVLSIKLMWGVLISKFKVYFKLYKKESALKEIETLSKQNFKFQPSESLPSIKQLRLWLEVAFGEAKKWSDDSVLLRTSLLLDVSGGKLIFLTSHFRFLSNWRKERMDVHISSSGMSKYYKEHSGLDDYRGSYQVNTKKFFEKHGEWKKAYALAYQKLENRIESGTFSSYINFNIYKKEVGFKWQYLKGKVESWEYFTFDGKEVRHSRDQQLKKI